MLGSQARPYTLLGENAPYWVSFCTILSGNG